MRIEFDPTNPTEAAAVRAMLTALTPRPTAGDLGIVMHEAPTDDAWHNGTTYTPPQPGSTIKVDDEVGFVVPAPETDGSGEPHDPRIHSTPPKLNADGTWRAKRGVTADQIAAVRAERDGTTDEPDVTPEGVEQEQPVTAPLAESAVSAPATPPAPPASEPSSTPTPAPTPPAPTAPVGTSAPSFLDVMKAITAAQKDGKIDTAKVKELCAAVGAGESTMGLNGPDNGDKRVAFMALLGEVVS